MFETLSQLPAGQLAYLIGVICAFSAFGVTLAFVHAWSNAKVSPRRTPAAASAQDLQSEPTLRMAA